MNATTSLKHNQSGWNTRRKYSYALKHEFCAYHDYMCSCCGREVLIQTRKIRLEIHHVVPISWGGMDRNENLVLVCSSCHHRIHRQLNNAIMEHTHPKVLESQILQQLCINALMAIRSTHESKVSCMEGAIE